MPKPENIPSRIFRVMLYFFKIADNIAQWKNGRGIVHSKFNRTERGNRLKLHIGQAKGATRHPQLNMNKILKQYPELPTSLLWTSLIIIASIAVYFNSLFNGFVFDDGAQVVNNPWLRSVKFIPNIFLSNVWAFEGRETSYYRPLMHIIYMITASVFGFKPWGFHFVNVLIHTCNSILIFLIGMRIFKGYDLPKRPFFIFPPFVAAILFSVHPIHTEAVAWIAGIPDLSCTFFSLASFYFFIRASDTNLPASNRPYLCSAALFFLATLCKEPALTLPLIFVVYDFMIGKEKVNFTSFIKKYSLYLVVVSVYFVMRLNALKSFAPVKEHLEVSNVTTIFLLFAKYLEKLFFPLNLSASYVIKPIDSIFEPRVVMSFLITIAFFFLLSYSFKRSKTAFFAMSCLIVPLLPGLYIPALGKSGAFAERYLYLPSVGFAMLLSLSIPYGVKKGVSAKILLSVIGLLIIVYSIGTVDRNSIWKNNYTLFLDTTRKAPDAALPHYNLGNELSSQGRIDEAIEQYQIALQIEPSLADVHDNLGIAFAMKGEYDKAINEIQLALQINPFAANAYNNLGIIYTKMGLWDRAIENFRKAIALKSDDVRFQDNLTRALEKKKASETNVRK